LASRGEREQLSLHEEFGLLCLHDKKGTIISEKSRLGMAGALLAELHLQGLIRVEASQRGTLVDADPSRWVNDPVLNECLQKIRKARRRSRLAMWVLVFAYRGRLARRVAERLCWRGILRADDQKLLLFFSRQTFPEINSNPEQAVIERLREAIFSDADDVSPRTLVLATLADTCDLLRPIFGRKELGPREVRIRQLTSGQQAGQHIVAAVNTAQSVLGVAGAAIAVATSPFIGALMERL